MKKKTKHIRYFEKSITNIDIQIKEYTDPIVTHWHIPIDIDFIISGTGTTYINNEKYNFRPGSLAVVVNPDTHSFTMDTKTTVYHLGFEQSVITNSALYLALKDLSSMYTVLEGDEYEYYLSLVKMLNKESESVVNTARTHAVSILETILWFIVRKNTLNKEFRSVSGPVKTIMNYINNNFTSNITLKELSNLVFLSEKHISRKFKQEMEIGINEYINKKRLYYSRNLLKSRDFAISDIAQQCGFNSASYYSKIFTEKFGVSPSEFRKK